MDSKTRKALDTILETMPDGAGDRDAVAFAVMSLASVLADDMAIVSRSTYVGDLVTFAAKVLGDYIGEEVEPFAMADGSLAFRVAGGEEVAAPSLPASMLN